MCGYRRVSMDGPWTSPVTVPSTDTRTQGYMYNVCVGTPQMSIGGRWE